MFYTTIPCAIIICCISNSTELENIRWVHKKLQQHDGHISYPKLIAFRLGACYLMMCPALFIESEFYLMILIGVVITPVIGFIVPVG